MGMGRTGPRAPDLHYHHRYLVRRLIVVCARLQYGAVEVVEWLAVIRDNDVFRFVSLGPSERQQSGSVLSASSFRPGVHGPVK